MPTESQWTWDTMLNAFRAFGGVADNIRNGSSGSGLHAQDAGRPVSLLVPANLCFALDDIDFIDGEITLKESADVGPGERKFFEAYCRAFSWGAGGGAEMASFVASLDALPFDARDLLEKQFAMPDLFEGEPAERTNERFLLSRCFRWKKRAWFAPIAELARHGARGLTPALDLSGRFCIQGTVSGEVLVSRGAYDTLDMYFTFGVVEPQEQAYSLPMDVTGGVIDLRIRRNTAKTVTRGGFLVPKATGEEGAVTFSFLMIGSLKSPRLSRGIFLDLARDTAVDKPDEAFDRVLYVNRIRLLQLLGALEPHGGEAVIALRKVAHIQLERISHCIGTRDL